MGPDYDDSLKKRATTAEDRDSGGEGRLNKASMEKNKQVKQADTAELRPDVENKPSSLFYEFNKTEMKQVAKDANPFEDMNQPRLTPSSTGASDKDTPSQEVGKRNAMNQSGLSGGKNPYKRSERVWWLTEKNADATPRQQEPDGDTLSQLVPDASEAPPATSEDLKAESEEAKTKHQNQLKVLNTKSEDHQAAVSPCPNPYLSKTSNAEENATSVRASIFAKSIKSSPAIFKDTKAILSKSRKSHQSKSSKEHKGGASEHVKKSKEESGWDKFQDSAFEERYSVPNGDNALKRGRSDKALSIPKMSTIPKIHAPKPIQVELDVQDYASREDPQERMEAVVHEWHEDPGWAKRTEEGKGWFGGSL